MARNPTAQLKCPPYQDDSTVVLRWKVDPGLDAPPSRQIVDAVLDRVSSGNLASGAKLPSVRGMAAEALVNHNTAARAYRELEHLSVVRGQNGRGVFVTEDGPRIARELRGLKTLAAFDHAAAEALRSGHGVAELRERLNALELNSR